MQTKASSFMEMEDLFRSWGINEPQILAGWFAEEQFSLDFLRTCTYEEIKPIADKLKLQQQTLFKRNFLLWTTSAPATPFIIDVINQSEVVEVFEPGPSGLQQQPLLNVSTPSKSPDEQSKPSEEVPTAKTPEKEQQPQTSLRRSPRKLNPRFSLTDNSIGSVDTLRNVLQRSLHGPAIFGFYSKNKCLREPYSNYVANEVIRIEFTETEGHKIQPNRFKELARYIVRLFPPLDKELLDDNDNPEHLWYVPSKKIGKSKFISPRGKLVNRYQALRKEYIDQGLIDSKRKKKSDETALEVKDVPPEILEKIEWLRNSTKPHETAKAYWVATCDYRLGELQEEQLTDEEYVNRYCILKTASACEMLLLDFKHKYDKYYDSLIKIWPSFKTKFVEHLKGNKAILTSLNGLNIDLDEADEDVGNIGVLRALAFILGVAKDINGPKGNWSTTKEDTIDGLITVVDSPTAVKPKIEAKKKLCERYGLKFQPFPIVVLQKAPLHCESYVVFTGRTKSVESPLVAVDTCFKIYQILWLEYPPEATIAWNFLQKVLYKFSTPADKQYMSVRNLASKLGF